MGRRPKFMASAHPFTVTEDVVYCITKAYEIVTFNKFNGSFINRITLPVHAYVNSIHITSDKTLFAVFKDKLMYCQPGRLSLDYLSAAARSQLQ